MNLLCCVFEMKVNHCVCFFEGGGGQYSGREGSTNNDSHDFIGSL